MPLGAGPSSLLQLLSSILIFSACNLVEPSVTNDYHHSCLPPSMHTYSLVSAVHAGTGDPRHTPNCSVSGD